jgi:hypothetical protein
MENELMMIDVNAIDITQGSVIFNQYERVKKEAATLAEQIKTVEVNEENIKQSKKLLAAVNKRCKELDDERIRIKKLMLEPYQDFEGQVKEILGIVKEADDEVRQQVRYLEEFERLQKEEAVQELFEKRKQHYKLANLIEFNHFVKPKHLNKTASLPSIEKEIIEFLERTAKDFEVIETMANAEAILSAYVGRYDLAAAISQVNEQEARKQQLEASGALKKQAQEKKGFNVMIYGEKNYKLVELFMNANDIDYKILN